MSEFWDFLHKWVALAPGKHFFEACYTKRETREDELEIRLLYFCSEEVVHCDRSVALTREEMTTPAAVRRVQEIAAEIKRLVDEELSVG